MKVISVLLVFGLVGLSTAQFGFSLNALSNMLTTTAKPRMNRGNVAARAKLTASASAAKQTVASETSSMRQNSESAQEMNHHVSFKLNTASNQESSSSKGFEMKLQLAHASSSGQDDVRNKLTESRQRVAAKLEVRKDAAISATKEKVQEAKENISEAKSTLSSKWESAQEKIKAGLESAKIKAEEMKSKLANSECLQKIQGKAEAKISSLKKSLRRELKERNLDTKIQKAEDKISEITSSVKSKIMEKSPAVQAKLELAKEKLDSLSASIKTAFGDKLRSLKLCA